MLYIGNITGLVDGERILVGVYNNPPAYICDCKNIFIRPENITSITCDRTMVQINMMNNSNIILRVSTLNDANKELLSRVFRLVVTDDNDTISCRPK